MSEIVQTIQQQPPASDISPLIEQLETSLLSPNGLLLIGCLGVLGVLYLMQGVQGSKKKLATARFGGRRERRAAQRLAIKQMKARLHNEVSLYINTPKDASDTRPLYLPDAQRGTAISGAPGSGKTYSVIDPMIRSSLEQGFSTIIYDFKYPTQTSRIIPYAISLGYEVHIFAPGFPESGVINLLDFLRDETDTDSARQLAVVLNKNFQLASQKQDDPFFTPAGDQLIEAVLAFAKSTEHPDLMMAQSVLSRPGLAERVASSKGMNPWIQKSFDQFVSVKDSEKTAASIAGTANNLFSRFMKPQIISAFSGKTTIPIDLEGKKLLVFGMDRDRRNVVSPLLAAIMHMIVTRNVSRKRHDPLVLALDELPTLYLPNLVNWINESREDGLVTILGFQNLGQLESTYGRDVARAIFGACATKALFNPQENASAEAFSNYLGKEEIVYKQRSQNYSKGGKSRNVSEQRQVRKLFESSQFLKLKTGECILLNPHFESRDESYIPIRQKIRIQKSEIKKASTSKKLWDKVCQKLIEQSPQTVPTAEDVEQRNQLAEALLPMPDVEGGGSDIANELEESASRLEKLL